MKIKRYKLFLESNEEDIDSICKKYGIKNYTINDDGTVDVDGDVNLSWIRRINKSYIGHRLTKLPLRFGKVTGYFNCSYNELTSLEGCPSWVGGYFGCTNNKLKTLDGGPEIVIGDYNCYNNKLVNFRGFPEDYDGNVSIYNNPVSELLINIPYEKHLKFIYWCNELNAIDDDGNVNEEWMEEVYNKLGLEY